MKLQIDFIDETNSVDDTYIRLIDELLNFAAKEEGLEESADMSITFVNNEAIQELNRTYRNIDESTDVISFALQEQTAEEVAIIGDELPPTSLGDVVISVDKAKEQAKDYDHQLRREYGFLALHGFLHLLGYDHQDPSDEEKMFSKQEELLNAFGLSRS